MKSSDIWVRRPRDSDLPAILRLLQRSLGEGEIPWTREYWAWKHNINPFGPSAQRVAVVDDDIIGVRVFMRWNLVADRREIACARPVDTATHPDWRRQGIFSELTRRIVDELRSEGVSLIFNTPNAQSRPANLSLGWSRVGRLRFSRKFVHPLRVIHARLFTDRNAEKLDGGGAAHTFEPSFSTDADVIPAQDFLARAAVCRFVERSCIPPNGRISISTSVDYLKWRYAKIPHVTYFAAWEGKADIEAAVIFRLSTNRTLSELRLCEMLVDDSRTSPSTVQELMHKAIDITDPDYALSVTSGGAPYRRTLFRMGFIPFPPLGPILVARDLVGGEMSDIDPYDIASWALPLGGVELF